MAKKNREFIGFDVDKDQLQRLDEYVIKEDITGRAQVIRKAIREFLKKLEKQKTEKK